MSQGQIASAKRIILPQHLQRSADLVAPFYPDQAGNPATLMDPPYVGGGMSKGKVAGVTLAKLLDEIDLKEGRANGLCRAESGRYPNRPELTADLSCFQPWQIGVASGSRGAGVEGEIDIGCLLAQLISHRFREVVMAVDKG